MNYLGKYGKYYDVPIEVERIIFSSDAEKLLVQTGPMSFRLDYEKCKEYDANRIIGIIKDFSVDVDNNTGAKGSLLDCTIRDGVICLRVIDPLGFIIEKMSISNRRAHLIHDSKFTDCYECIVKNLLENNYDDDTVVTVYYSDYKLVTNCKSILKYGKKIIFKEYSKYYDDCFSEGKVAIWVKGLRLTNELHEEIIKMDEVLL